jgi:hypothetical protein
MSRSVETKTDSTDPFDEIDFGTYFDEYLDPGYKSPASENVEKPSFETFLSSPVTLADYLHSQLSVLVMSEEVRDAADCIIGNLDENGYLTTSLEEIAEATGIFGGAHGGGAEPGAHPRSGGCGRARRSRMPADPVGAAKRGAAWPGRSLPTI